MGVRDGLLCRGRKIIVPTNLKQEIMTLVHSEAHIGVDKTIRLTRAQFFWKRMDSDTHLPQKQAETSCEREIGPTYGGKEASGHRSIRYGHSPIDLHSTQVLLTHGGYIFQVHRAVPMADQEASTIVTGIFDGWVHKHGPPNYMLSDQGPNVDGTEVRSALAKYGIEKLRSSPYHPEGDEQSERGIHEVKQMMRCLLQEKEIAMELAVSTPTSRLYSKFYS